MIGLEGQSYLTVEKVRKHLASRPSSEPFVSLRKGSGHPNGSEEGVGPLHEQKRRVYQSTPEYTLLVRYSFCTVLYCTVLCDTKSRVHPTWLVVLLVASAGHGRPHHWAQPGAPVAAQGWHRLLQHSDVSTPCPLQHSDVSRLVPFSTVMRAYCWRCIIICCCLRSVIVCCWRCFVCAAARVASWCALVVFCTCCGWLGWLCATGL